MDTFKEQIAYHISILYQYSFYQQLNFPVSNSHLLLDRFACYQNRFRKYDYKSKSYLAFSL